MTILIKNVLLIDGSGSPPAKVDVIVKNEKIAAMGYFPQYTMADEVIDGLGGAYLSPGFIDINTNSDLYLNLFLNSSHDVFLSQGITTIIGGQGGISLAPLLYGSLDLNKFWADPLKINTNWHSISEFLNTISRKQLGVNFGTLAGYSTIKYQITGDDFRDISTKELDVFKYLIDKSLKEGALGISIDLNFPFTNLTSYKEIKAVAEIVGKNAGLFSVKLRNLSDATVFMDNIKDNFLPAINEILNLSKETLTRIHINNFSCLKGLEEVYEEGLNLISENSANSDVSFDLHPYETSIVPLFSFLPSWAKRGSFNEIIRNLSEKEIISKIKKDLSVIKLDDVIIFNTPGLEYLIGKSIKLFAQERDLTVKDALIELMKITKLQASVVYKNFSTKPFLNALTKNRSIISSSWSGFPKNNRNFNLTDLPKTFSQTIEKSLKWQSIPIESTIKKITYLPAKRLGIKNRGIIREGFFADLVLFRDSGVETVLVNGKIAVKDGHNINSKNGKVLFGTN